jgi:hypothetical protein
MERLLLKLVIEVLKLLLQLVLWAVTGTWHRLGKKAGETKKAKPQQPRQKDRVKAPAGAALAPARRPDLAEHVPWEFVFQAEQTEREPGSEEEAQAFEDQRIARRKRAAARAREKLQVPALPPARRSIRSALHDPKTVRQALVLGAALGPRGRRD